MGSAANTAQGGAAAERVRLPALSPGFSVVPPAQVFAFGPCLSRSLEQPLARAGFEVLSHAPGIGDVGGGDPRSMLAVDRPDTLVQELRWAAGRDALPRAALLAVGRPEAGQAVDPTLGARSGPGSPEELMARRGRMSAYFARALDADLAVVTLSGIDGWTDPETGLALPNPLPALLAGEGAGGRLVPRRLTLEECEAALGEAVEILRSRRPDQRMLFAISPVPALTSPLPGDPMAAAFFGKAVLRVAIDRVAARLGGIDYVPLFEAAQANDGREVWVKNERRRLKGAFAGRMARLVISRYAARPSPAAGDPRATVLDPEAVETIERVQVRPFDRRDWGGPDAPDLPAHARTTVRGVPVCRFPAEWRAEAGGLPVLPGHYLYGGPLKVHFGHLLVDSVARLWAFDRTRHAGVVFAQRGGAPIRPWVHEILAAYGLGRDEIVVVDEPVVVERMDFPRPGSTMGLGPTPAYLDWLGTLPRPPRPRLRRRVAFGPKLYLGRLHMAPRGTLMGESYYARALEENGFVYFRPEQHSFLEQVRALEEAESVVFLEGSSIYSIERLRASGARFHMIPRRTGGDELFRPHVAPRAPFELLGDDRAIERFTARNGRQGPSGPSRTAAPETIQADMVRSGLIAPAPFDPEAFRAAERADAEAHADGDARRLAEILDWLDRPSGGAAA